METQEELLKEPCNFVHIVENGIRIHAADEYPIFDTAKFNRLEGTTFRNSVPFLSPLFNTFDLVPQRFLQVHLQYPFRYQEVVLCMTR